MEYIQVEHAQIPSIGLGTYGLIGREAREVVQRAIGMGYRHIDTAQMYENETEVGSGIAGTSVEREDVWVTTKVWHNNLKKGNFLLSVEESLRKLGVGYLDLLLIHWPNPDVSISELVDNLVDAQEKDYTRFVGVSNFPLSMLEELTEYGLKIVTNQVEYHPYLDQGPMLDWLKARGMALTAYSPLAQGQIAKDPVIKEIAQEIGRSPSQVVLRWLLNQGNVVAIPKSSRGDRLRDNLQITNVRLSAEHTRMIDQLARPDGRLINPEFAPAWD